MSSRFRLIYILFAFMLIFGSIGCANYEFWSDACENCISDEPTEGELRLQFLINDQYPEVVYKVYKGTVESGTLLFTDTAREEEVTWMLQAERDYAAEAFYPENGKTVVVVDGDKIRTQTTSCTDPYDSESTISCWYVVPARINLKKSE